METALRKYGDTENLPYGELVKGIVKYQSRPKRKKKEVALTYETLPCIS